MGCAALQTDRFFQHVEPFMEYRKTVYEVSDETLKSNRTDLMLFKAYVEKQNLKAITGPAVMNFHVYSGPNLPPIPVENCRAFRAKPATCSVLKLPLSCL